MFYIKHPPFLIVLLKYTSVKEFEFLMDMLTYIKEERRRRSHTHVETNPTQLNNSSVFTSFKLVHGKTETSTSQKEKQTLVPYHLIITSTLLLLYILSFVSYVNI